MAEKWRFEGGTITVRAFSGVLTDNSGEAMAERVLTDGEVEACWQAWKGDHHVALIRKVEEVVVRRIAESRFVPRRAGDVSEAEARERERKAWDACYAFITALAGRGLLGSRYDYPDKERDLRYPPLQAPRMVTLSDGAKVFALTGGAVQVVTPLGYAAYVTPPDTPFWAAKTPEDAEKLAALVRAAK